jgi:hypothetical protein
MSQGDDFGAKIFLIVKKSDSSDLMNAADSACVMFIFQLVATIFFASRMRVGAG